MSTSKHQVAHFDDGEEKFVLVKVDSKWAKDYGEESVKESIESHPDMTDHGKPILIAYVEGDDVTYYGAKNLGEEVAAFGWSNITWDEEELELEWEDEGEEEAEAE